MPRVPPIGSVAPHGLIGQSYDGDGLGIHGAVDVYDFKHGQVITSAMGEGAIEGTAEQYTVTSIFQTDFAFSRFGKSAARPRNATALSGKRVEGRSANSVAAVKDE